jgi:hypothetical protein
MRIFKRRVSERRPANPDPGAALRATISSVEFLPQVEGTGGARLDRRARLLRIVAEAVVLQDKAVELLADIRTREPLAELAPRGGPLVRRFCELRDRLPESDDRELRRITEVVGPVLDHHALMLSSSLDMLAVDWRSERIVEEGLGAPAERLDGIYARLAGTAEPVR